MEENLFLEAIYIFNKYCLTKKIPNNSLLQIESNLPQNILKAALRIMSTKKLVIYKDEKYYITKDSLLRIQSFQDIIKEEIISEDIKNISKKLKQINNPFFKDLTDSEYEVYCRCNFSVSYFNGTALSKIWDFSKSSILDIGGNSGGLGTAILSYYDDADVTISDKSIPCMVGNEYKVIKGTKNIKFIESDFFYLNLQQNFDYIILANILHDYNDEDCKRILEICKKHSHETTKILVLEDVLESENEPMEVLKHGLRLSVNTLYGKQRTVNELNSLMSLISMKFIQKEPINNIQSVIIYDNPKHKYLCT